MTTGSATEDYTPTYLEKGGFERDTDYIPDRITRERCRSQDPYVGDLEVPTWPVAPGRYRLVAARAMLGAASAMAAIPADFRNVRLVAFAFICFFLPGRPPNCSNLEARFEVVSSKVRGEPRISFQGIFDCDAMRDIL